MFANRREQQLNSPKYQRPMKYFPIKKNEKTMILKTDLAQKRKKHKNTQMNLLIQDIAVRRDMPQKTSKKTIKISQPMIPTSRKTENSQNPEEEQTLTSISLLLLRSLSKGLPNK